VLSTYLQGNNLNSNLILADEHDTHPISDLQQLNQLKTELVAIRKSEGFTARLFLSPPFFPVLLQTGTHRLTFIFFRNRYFQFYSLNPVTRFLHTAHEVTDLFTQMKDTVKYFAD